MGYKKVGNSMAYGSLFLVATPIGNLDDMTIRGINTLKEVDLIACEDTRHTRKLLNHFDIHTSTTSYHEHNKHVKGNQLIKDLKDGKNLALVTDAGTPGISDPGEELVKACLDESITVTSLPGAVAAITSLIISGQPTRYFCFEGFLPTDKKKMKERLSLLENETRTIILYEAPHRLKQTLTNLYKTLGNRQISITKELTKRHEKVIPTTLENSLIYFEENEPRGEFVLIIQGKDLRKIEEEQIESWMTYDLNQHMGIYLDQGLSKKDAMKKVAKDRGISKREVYAQLEKEKEKI